MTSVALLRQITDYANRPDPYPLYAELRKTPVVRDEDGPYLVSTYWEIKSLLHDPRVSSDARNLTPEAARGTDLEQDPNLPPAFIRLDPPEHDRLRRLAMRPFGPPHTPRRVFDMHGELTEIVSGLIDALRDRDAIDLVDDFSYPFPVTVICRLLGVPREDEKHFHEWADTIAASLDPPGTDEERQAQQESLRQARGDLAAYLAGLVEERRRAPRDDMLSAMATDHGPDGQMSPVEIITTAALLLVAGHETTVNLITNGMLTLLRNPDVLQRLRSDPGLAVPLVEELLRFEPPVQMLPQRTTLADIDIAGTIIPKGAPLYLMVASGSRDPQRFTDPDRFIPDRTDNQHLGFGHGLHNCFGAPLARLEAQLALTELVRRLDAPRLVEDPPPYRRNAVLRGPRHLPLTVSGIRD
ncbi:cytochrome P450 [Streptantibioticus rubrisoli]|uniref:Cytochrome P450 n=1 Tax=Streptantibioticus rubrisoli TaxID=1387313 RepID=A0ABT1PFC7_9ACTN|nr:cytochrome P450 [Streptantibioticus rubrisoli]MCQ4044078.1 cytochrome P450 [Streptantibioticus rubrisoli]